MTPAHCHRLQVSSVIIHASLLDCAWLLAELLEGYSSDVQQLVSVNFDAGEPHDNASFLINQARSDLACAVTIRDLLPSDLTPANDTIGSVDGPVAVVAESLQLRSPSAEQLALQLLGWVLRLTGMRLCGFVSIVTLLE